MGTTIVTRLQALADTTRNRLLLLLERQELTVSELCEALQLPQSTVSRHLKVLSDEGWITSRAEGVSNWYRAARELGPEARRLWEVVRDQFADSAPAHRDAERIKGIVAARHQRTTEFFASGAGQWDRVRGELFGDGLEWLALAGLLDPTWAVADLGAGTGHLAAALAPFVGRVVAIDESAAMLETAAERTKSLGNVVCRVGALEALPVESGTIHLAFAVLVLHHLIDPARAVVEAARTLRPGGRLVMVDMMPHERAEYRETMGHQWLGFDREAVFGWAKAAALEPIAYRPLPPKSTSQGPLLFVAVARKPHQPET